MPRPVYEMNKMMRTAAALFGALVLVSCTQSVPGEFRLKPADEAHSSGQTVTNEIVKVHGAPVDMLWVIDNSISMKSSQTKLKNGLDSFAKRFLKENTNIQIGVITTDAFLANPMWEKWLETPHQHRSYRGTPKSRHPNWGPEMAKLNARTLMKTQGLKRMSTLVNQFENEVAAGTNGHPEERAFDSVLQFISDNEVESSEFRLFRPGSHRIIVFLGDEDDQTVDPSKVGPAPHTLVYGDNFSKDPAIAEKVLPVYATATGCPQQSYRVCKTDASGAENCEVVTLEAKTVCHKPDYLLPVESFKAQLDQFFRKLDGSTGAPNYMVVSIVAKELETVKKLRSTVKSEIAHERGDRLLKLADIVGDGSFSMDIGIQNYSPILEKIGLHIEERSVQEVFKAKTTFTIDRVPVEGELFVVTLISNGVATELKPHQYTLHGNTLEIVDEAVIAKMKAGDQIQVRYQPSTVFPAGAASPKPAAAQLLSTN